MERRILTIGRKTLIYELRGIQINVETSNGAFLKMGKTRIGKNIEREWTKAFVPK